MKIFVSLDLEGVAGIVDWQQCVAAGDDYAVGRDLALGEVNAAIEGIIAAGKISSAGGTSPAGGPSSVGGTSPVSGTEILINDAHSVMRNLPPSLLAGRAAYLSGRFKPLYMMQGLDSSFDAIVFLGYHSAAGTPGILSHTYNPKAIADVRLDGVSTGEAGLNALVAQHFGVPVAVITGDQYVGPEAEPFCPGVTTIVVKESISRYAAVSVHPETARELVRDGVREALAQRGGLVAPQIAMPATLEVRFTSPDMAEQATWIQGVRRLDHVTVALTGDEPLALYQAFIALVYLTRSLVEN
ncbi:MAG: M55 family metallopeptidase [Hamadaea sp.]|uniref:M55 family metallopeptidase n=1 Tax=Hamadaea sp. TaxID=2024425 RepID=UPI00181B8330|nr:M55 family metallopeptidase [Hamadaea sp.]NUT18665.1 M55 family metallopeptidase [Hamadaea sp.]